MVSLRDGGAIYNAKGLDVEKVAAHRAETGSICGYPDAEHLENPNAGLELACDILVPAALENQLTAENATSDSNDYCSGSGERTDHTSRR